MVPSRRRDGRPRRAGRNPNPMWHLHGTGRIGWHFSHIRSTKQSARCGPLMEWVGLDGYRLVPKDGVLPPWKTVRVHVAEVEEAIPPPEQANAVLFDCLLVAVGVGQSIQVHHRQAREVADGAAVPGPHRRALRKQAVHDRRAHVGADVPVLRLHVVPCGIDEPERRGEVNFRDQNRNRRGDRRQTQNAGRARQLRGHEAADEVDADAAPQRHDERPHQIRRNVVPVLERMVRMHEENAVRELGEMARGQAGDTRREG